MKSHKPFLLLSSLLLGASYFAGFSQLEVYPLVKVQLMLLPIQCGVLFYLLVWRRSLQATASQSKPAGPKSGS